MFPFVSIPLGIRCFCQMHVYVFKQLQGVTWKSKSSESAWDSRPGLSTRQGWKDRRRRPPPSPAILRSGGSTAKEEKTCAAISSYILWIPLITQPLAITSYWLSRQERLQKQRGFLSLLVSDIYTARRHAGCQRLKSRTAFVFREKGE